MPYPDSTTNIMNRIRRDGYKYADEREYELAAKNEGIDRARSRGHARYTREQNELQALIRSHIPTTDEIEKGIQTHGFMEKDNIAYQHAAARESTETTALNTDISRYDQDKQRSQQSIQHQFDSISQAVQKAPTPLVALFALASALHAGGRMLLHKYRYSSNGTSDDTYLNRHRRAMGHKRRRLNARRRTNWRPPAGLTAG